MMSRKHFESMLRPRPVLAIILLCACGLTALAQVTTQMPFDPQVRTGKLDNGLTYYIRHNELPEHRAEFYIAQNVGSILEEPQQRGLAHFLEHMAFNGTRNFPGDGVNPGIVAWCETKGIKFGTNLNAYTSVDVTVYHISNVPTLNINVVDSCLLILHDWSNAILLQDEEIDKERGVIREEWRSRNTGIQRIFTDAQSTLYPNSKYADCMPIGNIDVINNFPYEDLREYYAKWYRPDLQGIVVVGDLDVDETEQKIKDLFSDISLPESPAKRVYYPVEDNEEPLVYIGTDKEISTPSVTFFFKHDVTPDSLKNTVGCYVRQYMISMALNMLNTRLYELSQLADPPFISAGAGYDNFLLAKTKDAFTLSASSKVNGMERAITTLLQETERARRFGFTESEYERARADYLQMMETAYNEREKIRNSSYVNEYVAHFTDAVPSPGVAYEYALINRIAPAITVESVNKVMRELVTLNNQAVLLAGPQKDDIIYPTRDEICALLQGMPSYELTAYEDEVIERPLLEQVPQGGVLLSMQSDCIYGTTLLTLGNGVRVYIKPTDFKADQIMMQGVSLGGSSLFPDEEIINILQLNNVALVGGIGEFSKIDLSKALAGKQASVQAGIGRHTESVSGNCAPRDFETMMQLLYLTFTSPRYDLDAFDSYKSRLKASLENAEAKPMNAFADTVTYALYGDHPRAVKIKANMVDQINYDKVLEMYIDRYKDAGDFTFFLVGNIDMDTMIPLITQYLGALPVTGRKETFRDTQQYIRKGFYKTEFLKEQETPMATIMFMLSGNSEYNLRQNLLASMLEQVLNMVYTEEIRENKGGTYGVSCKANITKYPKEEFTLQIMFKTDPTKREELSALVKALLVGLTENGPKEEHVQKVKEYMLKQHQDAQKENGYWINMLNEYFYTGVDFTQNYPTLVNEITGVEIQEFLKRILAQGNEIQVTMSSPE